MSGEEHRLTHKAAELRRGRRGLILGGTTAAAASLAALLLVALPGARSAPSARKGGPPMSRYAKPDDQTLKSKLSELQYRVTQQNGTEPPFQNDYWDNKQAGLYVDVVTGEPLFSSLDKFDSGSGWPSFTRPLEPEHVQQKSDRSHGMVRTEVRSKAGDSHLGHVFDDGPGPSGQRYCINSAALRFVPVAELAAEGYGRYLPLFGLSAPEERTSAVLGRELALLAGGCFWGVEELLRQLPGVIETTAGYTGGSSGDPDYDQVKTGRTGHAEAVRVVFDPARVSYAEILRYFFRLHDPTTINRQGNDIGSQYRSAIFYTSEEQRRVAEQVREQVNSAGRWQGKVVSEIVPAGPFYPAESYHQDYLQKNPGGYTCHFLRD